MRGYSIRTSCLKLSRSCTSINRRPSSGYRDDAVNIGPPKIGPQIYYVPSSHHVLKVGVSVTMAEVEEMRLIASRTSVPVPNVFESHEKDGFGCIFMSKVSLSDAPKREAVRPLQYSRGI